MRNADVRLVLRVREDGRVYIFSAAVPGPWACPMLPLPASLREKGIRKYRRRPVDWLNREVSQVVTRFMFTF
jgi:hypothetical protein